MVTAAFMAEGHDCVLDCASGGELPAALDRAVADAPDILVAGGGDGTVRSAAAAVLGKPIALAPIPLGTLNRFARDLRIPLNPPAAARALAGGTRGLTDVAEVNGRIFLCNSMLGLPPEMSVQRGALRGKGVGARIAGYLRLIRTLISSRHKITVSIDDGQTRRRVRALSIVVSNNLYAEEVSPLVLRSSLSDGVLGLYISRHRSGAGMAFAFVRAMLGLWKRDPSLEFAKARRLTLIPHGDRVRVANDGEVVVLSSPLNYRIRPKVLMVLRPRESPAEIVAPLNDPETAGFPREAQSAGRDPVASPSA